MTEAEWLACTDPQDMLNEPGWRKHRKRPKAASCHPHVSGERKFRLYSCACFRLSFPHPRYAADRQAVIVAERYAEGLASEAELIDVASRCGATAATMTFRPAINAARSAAGGGGVRADHPAGPQAPLPFPVKCRLLRDIFGNPFRPVTADPRWLTSTAVGLAQAIYGERAFDRLPILADALEEAGCDNADILTHCRGSGPHVRGCWAVDLVLGKQ